MNFKYIKYFIFCFLLPLNLTILFFAKIFRKFINLKFYKINTEKMGHFFFDTLLFLERKKTRKYHENYKLNLIIPFIDIYLHQSNKYLLKFWKKFFYIDTTGFTKYLYLTNNLFFKNKNLNITIRPYDYDDSLKNFNPRINFTSDELKKGEDYFNKVGIGKNDKFVCLLLRDPRYFKETYPNRDYSYQDYRNVNLKNYKDACKFLTSKNIFVIRMGKFVEEEFSINDEKVIDYASSKFRSDFLDIFISSKCFFWITVGSGIDASSYIFQKPVLYTNRAPLGYTMGNKFSLSIMKHYYDIESKKKLSLSQISNNSLLTDVNTKILNDKKINLIENTSSEILESTKEIYYSLNNTFEFKDNRLKANNKINKLINYNNNTFFDIHDQPIQNFKNYPFFSYNFLKNNNYLLK